MLCLSYDDNDHCWDQRLLCCVTPATQDWQKDLTMPAWWIKSRTPFEMSGAKSESQVKKGCLNNVQIYTFTHMPSGW